MLFLIVFALLLVCLWATPLGEVQVGCWGGWLVREMDMQSVGELVAKRAVVKVVMRVAWTADWLANPKCNHKIPIRRYSRHFET